MRNKVDNRFGWREAFLILLFHIRIYALDPRFRGDDRAENPLKKGNRHPRESGDPEATNADLEM